MAVAVFTQAMTEIIQQEGHKDAWSYLDNAIIGGRTKQEHNYEVNPKACGNKGTLP